MKLLLGTFHVLVGLALFCSAVSSLDSKSAARLPGWSLGANVGLLAAEPRGRTDLPRLALRLCNAYTFTSAMDILQKDTVHSNWEPWRLTNGPLPYKQCIDLEGVHVRAGDQFLFLVGTQHIGTFAVAENPVGGSMLQLVIYRHDEFSTTADFSSHLFSDSHNPQIAIVDTYHGATPSPLNILSLKDGHPVRDQPLHFGNVISMQPGTYELQTSLKTSRVGKTHDWEIEAEAGQKYSLLRVGIEPLEGPAYPEDIFIFPAVHGVYGAAATSSVCRSLVILVLASAAGGAGVPRGS